MSRREYPPAPADAEHEAAPESPAVPAYDVAHATLAAQARHAALEHEAAHDPQRATIAEKDAHHGYKARSDATSKQTIAKAQTLEQITPSDDESPEEQAGIAQMAEQPRARRDLIAWSLAAAGPAVWFLDLVIAWAVTPPAHEQWRLTELRSIHAGALVLTLAIAVLAVIELRRVPRAPHSHIRDQRALFVSTGAVVLGVLSVVLVIGNLIPTLILVPGMEP